MITPNDIAVKEFKKSAVGYSPEEVDAFLDEICIDYDRLMKENIELKDKIGMLHQDNEKYHSIQGGLERTLVLAEKAAAEMKEAAMLMSEQIKNDARQKAEEILSDARTKVYELEQDIARLENRYELMRTRVKLLLYAEIELLDKNEIFAEKEEALQQPLKE
ncbi:MAG: DivIVA domain-containing protein [Epulopiscium sp.]|jgi:cell division initiation protein|nr:DivIVA domain-containing protein [Candidatus Epulonipiscium sp.]